MERRAVRFFAWLCVLAVPAAAFAAGSSTTRDTVFFTGTSSNDTISKVNSFGTCSGSGSVSKWIKDNGKNLKGIVVRGEGPNGTPLCIIAANSTQGGNLRLYNATTQSVLGTIASVPKAKGVDVDRNGNIYAVNDDIGGPDQLWYVPRTGASPTCSLGNYGARILIDSQVDGANQLADVKVVTAGAGNYGLGDVLVLVREPAMLLRYARAGIASRIAGGSQPTPQVFADTADFDDTNPNSFSFGPNGGVVVATDEGRILQIDANGVRQGDLNDDLPGNGVGIGFGLQQPGDNLRVFVTVHQQKKVLLFDGNGTCVGAAKTQTPPHGVGNASFNVAGVSFTPVGSLVGVSPTSSQLLTFERANTSGVTRGTPCLLKDPDPDGSDRLVDFSPCGATGVVRNIPGYIRGFDHAGPHNGPTCSPVGSECPTFFVIVNDSNVDIFSATLEHHIEEEDFGFETTCYDGGGPHSMQPRTFFCGDANDPPIVEGGCTDISTGCGSNIGRGGERSIIVTGWDSRSVNSEESDIRSVGEGSSPKTACSELEDLGVAGFKLGMLEIALDEDTHACSGGLTDFIGNTTAGTLRSLLQQAINKFRCGYESAAQAKLEAFICAVKTAPPGAFDDNIGGSCSGWSPRARNTPGELIARAESAIFMICGAGPACQQLLANSGSCTP
jgi:hypothetical protein